MSVSCFTVLWQIVSKPKNENIFWLYILRPLLWFLVSVVAGAATYLYLVPLTNIVGMGLFADYTCPNTGVWQVCGRETNGQFDPNGQDVAVGFFVFLIVLSTVGLYIVGTIFYICSRRKGYVKRFAWSDCCNVYWCCEGPRGTEEWVVTDDTPSFTDCDGSEYFAGPYLYFTSTILFAIATFMTTIIVGIWVGRFVAVNTNTPCLPYQNTRIGLYGCVNSNGQYVGGQDCKNCAGLGFAILGLPLFIVEFFAISIFICMKKCRTQYKATKERLRLEQDQALAVDNSGIECNICNELLQVCAVLPCHETHIICSGCSNKIDKCPFCRKEFKKGDIVLHKKEITL